jgi:hypothetical protein
MGYLSDRLTATAPQIKAACGTTVTYGASSITALWAPEQCIQEYYPDGEQLHDLGVLSVLTADVASPAIGDTVTISSNTWVVKAIGEANTWVPLQLARFDRETVGRGNKRGAA